MAGADAARAELEYTPEPAAFHHKRDRGLIFSRPVHDTALNRAARGSLVAGVLALDRFFQRTM